MTRKAFFVAATAAATIFVSNQQAWSADDLTDIKEQITKQHDQTAKQLPTEGKPGVFATLDAGAQKTVGIYFMYDVKQFDPAEWTSPPTDAALVDKPDFGKVVVGRGAVNQKGPESAFLAALHAIRAAGKNCR